MKVIVTVNNKSVEFTEGVPCIKVHYTINSVSKQCVIANTNFSTTEFEDACMTVFEASITSPATVELYDNNDKLLKTLQFVKVSYDFTNSDNVPIERLTFEK